MNHKTLQMKKYLQPLAILYLASALLVSGYLFINPPLSTKEYESSFDASQAKKSLPKGIDLKKLRVMENTRIQLGFERFINLLPIMAILINALC